MRNGFGEVIQIDNPDTGITVYQRDARGLITQKTDARGVVTDYTYDVLSRMTAKTFPASASENISFTYDETAGGNFGIGQLTSMADESGTTAWVYDARGNIAAETRTIGTFSYTTAYLYDAADNITEITYPSGRIVTFDHNALGQTVLVETAADGFAPVETVVSGIARQPMSNVIQAMAFGNGLDLSNSFQQDYFVDAMTTSDGATALIDRSHARGDLINLTAITDNIDPAADQSFGYTASNRLATAGGAWGDYTFG